MNELREKAIKYCEDNLIVPKGQFFTMDGFTFVKHLESFIQSQPINKVVTDNTKVNTNALERIKELEKENQELNGYVNYWTSLAHKRKDQITQLQKKIDKAYEALNDIVWLIERGASMDEVIESVNAKARPFLLKK